MEASCGQNGQIDLECSVTLQTFPATPDRTLHIPFTLPAPLPALPTCLEAFTQLQTKPDRIAQRFHQLKDKQAIPQCQTRRLLIYLLRRNRIWVI